MGKFPKDAIKQFKSEFNNVPILESTTLNMAANELINEILKTIEKLTLATTKTITSRHKKPWYDEDLKKTKKNHEKQRKEMDQIQGRPTVEGIQKGMKQICHNAQVQKVQCNTQPSQYEQHRQQKTIMEITGQNKQNPLPASTSDQELAKDCVAFFFHRLQNIRKLFKGTHKYTPKPNDTPHLE